MTVLVAFASARGSTRSIAERIAAQLSDRGVFTVCASVDDVDNLLPYSAVVVGSAVHDQMWLPKAIWFLTDHADDLARRPVWLFSVGRPGTVARPLRWAALCEGTAIERELTKVVRAKQHRLFSGVVPRGTFPQGSSRLAFRLMGCRYGDFRDWPSIDEWAAAIARDLDNRVPPPDSTPADVTDVKPRTKSEPP